MFGKKETIEDDFMAYGTGSGHKGGGGFMGKLIQFLTVIILLGAISLMGLFGYRYLQKNRAIEAAKRHTPPAQPIRQSPAAAQAVTTAEQPHVDPKTGQRMYTQEEMQQIVRMLMEQVKPQLTQPAAQQTSETTQPTTEAESVVAAQTAPETANDADALLAELQTTEADEIEEVDLPVVKDIKKVEAAKATEAKKDVAVDHYNKVVVNDDANSYDDLAKLSEEIGTIVRDMDKKGKSSDYTASIKKEVATRQSEMRVIIVRKGDSLSKIAKRAYGNAMAFDRILEANPELIKNPNMIYVGQRLRVPMEK